MNESVEQTKDEFLEAWNKSPLSGGEAIVEIIELIDEQTLKKLSEKLRNPVITWKVCLSTNLDVRGFEKEISRESILDTLMKDIHQTGVREWVENSLNVFKVINDDDDDEEEEECCADCGYDVYNCDCDW